MENDEQIPEESILLSSVDTALDWLHGSSLTRWQCMSYWEKNPYRDYLWCLPFCLLKIKWHDWLMRSFAVTEQEDIYALQLYICQTLHLHWGNKWLMGLKNGVSEIITWIYTAKCPPLEKKNQNCRIKGQLNNLGDTSILKLFLWCK